MSAVLTVERSAAKKAATMGKNSAVMWGDYWAGQKAGSKVVATAAPLASTMAAPLVARMVGSMAAHLVVPLAALTADSRGGCLAERTALPKVGSKVVQKALWWAAE